MRIVSLSLVLVAAFAVSGPLRADDTASGPLGAYATTPSGDIDYSYIQKDFFSAYPHGGAFGRGGDTVLNYVISDNAFYTLGAEGYSIAPGRGRRYDIGIGINSSSGASGLSLFSTLGWNHMGFDPVEGPPGRSDHGFGAAVGLRYMLSPRWEAFATLRHDHNDVLATATRGDLGLWWTFTHGWQLGGAVYLSSAETDYLISIRAYY